MDCFKRSVRIIAVSNSTRNDLIKFYGKKFESKIDIIWEGVENNNISEIEKVKYFQLLEVLKQKYKFEQYFLYVGNNRPHKNLRRVFEAFAKFNLKNSSSSVKFIWVGRKLKNDNYLEKIKKDFNIEDKLLQLEVNEEQLKSIYLGAIAFVFCSISEGFGLPILEAMSFGVPVITSNLSSMKEIAENYSILVNPYSIDEIANAMKTLIEDPSLQKKLSKKGLNRANELTWEKCGWETFKLYTKILQV